MFIRQWTGWSCNVHGRATCITYLWVASELSGQASPEATIAGACNAAVGVVERQVPRCLPPSL